MCDFKTNSRKDLNIHMVKYHTNIELIDGISSLNSTFIEEIKPETNSKDEPEFFK